MISSTIGVSTAAGADPSASPPSSSPPGTFSSIGSDSKPLSLLGIGASRSRGYGSHAPAHAHALDRQARTSIVLFGLLLLALSLIHI